MMVVMMSSSGASWQMFAAMGDKVFLIETTHPPEEHERDALAHMVRECRWMFGNLRIVYLDRRHEWVEVLHNGAGKILDTEPYDGPVPNDNREAMGHG